MTEGKLYGVCYVCERTTGSKYSVNNHGRKCTGRAAAIPAVGCRCGVSPIMSTIIQRYRERAEIRRSRRRSRGSRSPYPCGFTRSASFARVYHVPSPFLRRSSSTFSLFLSLSLSLSFDLPFSSSGTALGFPLFRVSGNRSRSPGRRFVPVSETAIYINLGADGSGVPLIG